MARGGVVDEHALMLGGVVVGELPEQPMPLTECWYNIESPTSVQQNSIVSYADTFTWNKINRDASVLTKMDRMELDF